MRSRFHPLSGRRPDLHSVLQNVFFSVEGVREKVVSGLSRGRTAEDSGNGSARHSSVGAALKPPPYASHPGEAAFFRRRGRQPHLGTGVTSRTAWLRSEIRSALSRPGRRLRRLPLRRENPRAACMPISRHEA